MGFFRTPDCKFCFHERADLQHILWHCPRFRNIRDNWPSALLPRTKWPACAETALIFTKEMDKNLKRQWKGFQKYAAELLVQWMEINRNPELYDPLSQQSLNIQRPDLPALPLEANNQIKQKVLPNYADLLPLQWRPPLARTDLNKWAATPAGHFLIFSFWTRATLTKSSHATKIKTWSQALAIFIQVGGKAAPFLAKCLNVGTAAYNLKPFLRIC